MTQLGASSTGSVLVGDWEPSSAHVPKAITMQSPPRTSTPKVLASMQLKSLPTRNQVSEKRGG